MTLNGVVTRVCPLPFASRYFESFPNKRLKKNQLQKMKVHWGNKTPVEEGLAEAAGEHPLLRICRTTVLCGAPATRSPGSHPPTRDLLLAHLKQGDLGLLSLTPGTFIRREAALAMTTA